MLNFILGIFIILSIDSIFFCLIWILYKYVDLKYFSNFEITTLREENKYLRNENKKVSGTSSNFWSDDND